MYGSYAATTGEDGTPGFSFKASCAGFAGDANGDGVVNFADLHEVRSNFGESRPCAAHRIAMKETGSAPRPGVDELRGAA